MKKVLLALFAAAAILAACTPEEVLPSSIQLNKTQISLVEGDNFTLQALVNPSDAANKEVTWSSSADVVATVDQTGKVVALKEGTATITATSKATSSVKGTCEVTVTKKPIPVTAVQIAEEPDRMVPEETLQLTAVITPRDATDNTVTWSSDNTDVAVVDANGLVTAVGGGTAYITATVGGITSDPVMVVVIEPRSMFVRYPSCLIRTGYSITQTVWYGTIDDWAHKTPNDDPLTWTSSNDLVATPEDGNLIRAVGPGTATLTGVDLSGSKVSFIVNVEDRPDSVYDDYLPGVPIVDCHAVESGNVRWFSSEGRNYALTDGYSYETKTDNGTKTMDTGIQCMGAKVAGYKIAEIYLGRRVDASMVENPALFIRVYISDPSKLKPKAYGIEPYIELRTTESLTEYEEADNARIRWSLSDNFTNINYKDGQPIEDDAPRQTLVAGWNNIVLPFDKCTTRAPGFKENNITYFRMYHIHGEDSYEEIEFRFDQIRIIDWTEFDSCDNFTMWRDRPAQQNQYSYVDDTETKIQGRSCITCKDVLMNAVSSYRLEMWPGVEYAMPARYDIEDLAIQFKFWCDDPEFFMANNFNVEIASHLTADHNGFDMSIGPQGDYDWPQPLQVGWNTIKLNFKDYMNRLKDDYNFYRFNYFRLILTPIGEEGKDYQVGYHTFKLDDIRIVNAD